MIRGPWRSLPALKSTCQTNTDGEERANSSKVGEESVAQRICQAKGPSSFIILNLPRSRVIIVVAGVLSLSVASHLNRSLSRQHKAPWAVMNSRVVLFILLVPCTRGVLYSKLIDCNYPLVWKLCYQHGRPLDRSYLLLIEKQTSFVQEFSRRGHIQLFIYSLGILPEPLLLTRGTNHCFGMGVVMTEYPVCHSLTRLALPRICAWPRVKSVSMSRS